MRIAAHFFSTEESRALKQLRQDEIAPRFFRTWVRKEAYLKAVGKGFAIDPAQVTVPRSRKPGVRVVDQNGEEKIDKSFAVYDLPGIEEHAAALAIAGELKAPPSIELIT